MNNYDYIFKFHSRLFVDNSKLTNAVRTHLCPDVSRKEFCVTILNYSDLSGNLTSIMSNSAERLWVSLPQIFDNRLDLFFKDTTT